MDRTQLENHVRIVGILHIGLGALGLLAAVIFFTLFVGIGALAASGQDFGVLLFMGILVGAFLGLLSIPGVVGGVGLLKYKSWARYLVLVLAVFQLFNVPIGTAVGVYSIWILAQQEATALFEGQPAA
jgi:hypothetical protein